MIPGRAFLQRLYQLSVGVSKPYHYVTLNQATKLDLQTWLIFLENFNGVKLYREELFLSKYTLHLFTDSSQSLGCGGVFKSHWFSVAWPSEWWSSQNITFLELVPIILAAEVWGDMFRNASVLLHTDNLALVYVINKQSSKEPLVMSLVRRLVIQALNKNFDIKATHISGKHNVLADYLSRLQVSRFLEMFPSADKSPTKVDLPLQMS